MFGQAGSACLSGQHQWPEGEQGTWQKDRHPFFDRTFAGSTDPSVYVEIKSIGALKPPAMTAAFCTLISERTGIPANRIYIGFDDVKASAWGWNGNTFG